MNKSINLRIVAIAVVFVIAIVWKLLITPQFPQLSNYSPLGALALFAGCYFVNKGRGLAITLGVLLLVDMIMMNVIYAEFAEGLLYSGWYWVYLGIAMMVGLGMLIRKVNVPSVLIAGVGAALVHWIVSDIGVWLGGTNVVTGLPFAKTFGGYVECLTLALPFLKNALLSNALFGGLFFGAYELVKQYVNIKSPKTIAA